MGLKNCPIYCTILNMRQFTVFATAEYTEWFDEESEKSKFQIQNRLSRIEISGHFGTVRNLKKHLLELKFNDGRRIYYTIVPESNVILLIGGNKHGQEKDIKKARKILASRQESKD